MKFKDRRHAGEILGEAVAGLRPTNPVVFCLPRGGAPVGFEVAAALDCPMDMLLVRKVGVPYQPELAMGAVGESGVVVRNTDVMSLAGIEPEDFDEIVRREAALLDERLSGYRATAEAIDPAGLTAVVVDDGLATGSTARAAIDVLRERKPEQVWLAVPVGPADTVALLSGVADRVVAVDIPEHFGAVGLWYKDFTQTTDDEVRDLLARSRLR